MNMNEKFYKALEKLEEIAESESGMKISDIYLDIVAYKYYIEDVLNTKNKQIKDLENDLDERKRQWWNHNHPRNFI